MEEKCSIHYNSQISALCFLNIPYSPRGENGLNRPKGQNELMMEKRTEVKTFLVERICSVCDFGTMEGTGRALMTFPPKYVHQCTQCENTEDITKRYPYTEQMPLPSPPNQGQ